MVSAGAPLQLLRHGQGNLSNQLDEILRGIR
jgi:hypothetical protein